MDIKELLTALGSSSLALVIFYFYNQSKIEAGLRIAKLEAEITELRKQHDTDIERLIRRRSGDTGRIPELPPDEVKKFKKSIGE